METVFGFSLGFSDSTVIQFAAFVSQLCKLKLGLKLKSLFAVLFYHYLACVPGTFAAPTHQPQLSVSPQNFLRCQNNKNNYNLVCETLQFLDCICGSTTGGLGLLGLYINEKNVALINQTLESLTEYCQGPCHENQVQRGTASERAL